MRCNELRGVGGGARKHFYTGRAIDRSPSVSHAARFRGATFLGIEISKKRLLSLSFHSRLARSSASVYVCMLCLDLPVCVFALCVLYVRVGVLFHVFVCVGVV